MTTTEQAALLGALAGIFCVTLATLVMSIATLFSLNANMNSFRAEMVVNDNARCDDMNANDNARLANVERLLPEYDALHARIDAVERGQAALDDRIDALAASPSE